MLWLALYCPCFALEIFAGDTLTEATVVVTADGAREQLVACNVAAWAAGLEPGMSLAAAQSRVPDLRILVRDDEAEHSALQHLAEICLNWSDHVAPEPPAGILLEIGRSRRLFDGLEPILAQVDERLASLGHTAVRGVAPTPAAARLLARTGGGFVTDSQSLEHALAPLPAAAVTPDERSAQRLAGWGVKTLGECFALPRAGLARRLGPALIDRLDRLRGTRSETVVRFEPPHRFHNKLALPVETADLVLPLAALERLTAELEAWLRMRDSAVERFEVDLYPQRGARTSVCIGLAQPGREAAHLLGLAHERLARMAMPEAISAVGLRSHRPVAFRPPAADLWAGAGREPPERLLERLRARLGHAAVWGLGLRADHRPERAWEQNAPGAVPAHAPAYPPVRPLWLLPSPGALTLDAQNRPCCRGRLQLLGTAERVETGWWDGDDVERDYFVARNPAGSTLWIYRERRVPRRWYLHGLFA